MELSIAVGSKYGKKRLFDTYVLVKEPFKESIKYSLVHFDASQLLTAGWLSKNQGSPMSSQCALKAELGVSVDSLPLAGEFPQQTLMV